MFLYTICPSCQAGYDVPQLFRGKKLVCKTCSQAFAVTASPRPKNRPPLRAFAGPQRPEPEDYATAVAEPGTPTRLDVPPAPIFRPITKAGTRPVPPSRVPASGGGAGGWVGKGGGVVIAIVATLAIRGCLAASRPTPRPPTYNPPQIQWQQPPPVQWNPPPQDNNVFPKNGKRGDDQWNNNNGNPPGWPPKGNRLPQPDGQQPKVGWPPQTNNLPRPPGDGRK
jgi:hypothetical protein